MSKKLAVIKEALARHNQKDLWEKYKNIIDELEKENYISQKNIDIVHDNILYLLESGQIIVLGWIPDA